MSKTTLYILAMVVALTAVAYFSLTSYRTINPDDEGYLLHNYQKAAEGQVPHRDFYDDYGPAIYWLGGSLFRVFGTKLIVIRVFVLALKTAMALLIFLIGRKLLPPAFAVLAAMFFIISWGDPFFPAFNILYAGFVSHFLALLGILFMIAYIEKDNRLWLMGTAACLGASALFKFHSAAFDFIGFSVFLSMKEGAVGLGGDAIASPSGVGATAQSRLMRLGKLLGAPVVALFYLTLFARDRLDLYYFFIFLAPYFLLLGYIFASDVGLMRGEAQAPNNLRNCYSEILTVAGGVMVFISLTLLYYWRVGGLEELIYDTFALPLAMNFYLPMEDYRLHAGLIAATVALISILAWMAARLRERSQTTRKIFWAVCFFMVLLAPTILILRNISLETWHKRTIYLLSPITLMICAYLLMSTWRKEKISGSNTRETLSLALVFIIACQGLIMSFPRTDTAHIQINNTTIFILISFLLWRMHAGWVSFFRGNARFLALTSVAAALALVATTFVWSMKTFLLYVPVETGSFGAIDSDRMLEVDFPRSKGLSIPMWYRPLYPAIWEHIVGVTNFIAANTSSDESVFLLCELQVVHFLADRDSAVMKENYFVYLASAGLIDRADDVRLTDDQLLGQLVEARPRFVVQTTGGEGEHTKRIASLWPKTYRFIRENYRVARIIGVYEILQDQSAGPGARNR